MVIPGHNGVEWSGAWDTNRICGSHRQNNVCINLASKHECNLAKLNERLPGISRGSAPTMRRTRKPAGAADQIKTWHCDWAPLNAAQKGSWNGSDRIGLNGRWERPTYPTRLPIETRISSDRYCIIVESDGGRRRRCHPTWRAVKVNLAKICRKIMKCVFLSVATALSCGKSIKRKRQKTVPVPVPHAASHLCRPIG